MKLYGEKIKMLRERMLITQKELADILFVSLVTINRWENNKSQPQMKNKRELKKLLMTNQLEDK